jgi:predicted MFS family arabinose efflux permease
MGIGRFAYTPILPLMTAHAGLTPHAAAHLATANYAGYLAGALAGTFSTRLARSATALRISLVVLVATVAAMPLTSNLMAWGVLRTVAGFASALVFVIAINSLLEHLRDHSPHLPGWGFGGVGVGIALSGALVLSLPPSASWRTAWWAAAGLAAVLSAAAWAMHGGPKPPSPVAATPTPKRPAARLFAALFVSYTLEGIGYIIAGTFLVAAIRENSTGWLGNGAWLLVGVAAAPSAALWAWLSKRWSHAVLLVAALLLQAVGIAMPAVTHSAIAALFGAMLFGATFIGVSTLALAAGRLLQFPGSVALLTAGYSAGQIAGPVLVNPLLAEGFRLALIAAAMVVVSAAGVAVLLRAGVIRAGADRLVATNSPGRP